MEPIGRGEVVHRAECTDLIAEHGRKRNGRPDERAPAGQPDLRHARRAGKSAERRDRTIGYPNLRAEIPVTAHISPAKVTRSRR